MLFLHADTVLPDVADTLIAQALANGVAVWGRFDVRIDGRSRWSGVATGDQAMFMTRAAFDAVGGFACQPLMEDIEMSARLHKLSRPACLRAKVITSGRRWETHGVWRTIGLMWWLRLAYWCGAVELRVWQWQPLHDIDQPADLVHLPAALQAGNFCKEKQATAHINTAQATI